MRNAELLAQRREAIIQGKAQLEIANHPLGVTTTVMGQKPI
jgi:hypothetical protein